MPSSPSPTPQPPSPPLRRLITGVILNELMIDEVDEASVVTRFRWRCKTINPSAMLCYCGCVNDFNAHSVVLLQFTLSGNVSRAFLND